MSDEAARWHLITGEYPPAVGGVAAFTREIAAGLARAGASVHVWTTGEDHPSVDGPVAVHREARGWNREGRRRVETALDRTTGARTLFVQWVPHAFSARAVNLPFARWVAGRARAGDRLAVMVHEPFLPYRGSIRQHAAAAVQRMMLRIVLERSSRVFVSTPAWIDLIRPYLPAGVSASWLPVPASVRPVDDPRGTSALRARFCGRGESLVGHFGTFAADTRAVLERVIPGILSATSATSIVLFGRGSTNFAERLRSRLGTSKLHAMADVTDEDASRLLRACDVMLLPYSDGATTRRTTLLSALAHGCAVVTTRGFLTEPLWDASNAVCLEDVSRPLDLRDAVLALLRDPVRRESLGRAAAALYDDRFDVRHAVALLNDNWR